MIIFGQLMMGFLGTLKDAETEAANGLCLRNTSLTDVSFGLSEPHVSFIFFGFLLCDEISKNK